MSFKSYVAPGYEFSQGVLLDKFKDKSVNGGICLSLTSFYLTAVKDKAGMAHSAYKAFRSKYGGLVTPDVAYSTPTEEFGLAAHVQKQYSKDFGGGIEQMDAATAMKFASNSTMFLGQNFRYTPEIMPGKIKTALLEHSLILLAFSCKGGAHAVGVAVDAQENLVVVFDPNYGAAITSIAGREVDEFFDTIIGALITDYTISTGWASACISR